MLIAISGTPGTGKSTLAKKLAVKLGFYRLDLSQHYSSIKTGYDKQKKCFIVDIHKIEMLVADTLQKHKNMVLDSHVAHLLPSKIVDICVIVQCSDLKQLQKRLKEKQYSASKIRENLDAEIFQVCLHEAEHRQKKVIVVDTANAINVEKLTRLLRTSYRIYCKPATPLTVSSFEKRKQSSKV
jgi:adenylate kinase